VARIECPAFVVGAPVVGFLVGDLCFRNALSWRSGHPGGALVIFLRSLLVILALFVVLALLLSFRLVIVALE